MKIAREKIQRERLKRDKELQIKEKTLKDEEEALKLKDLEKLKHSEDLLKRKTDIVLKIKEKEAYRRKFQSETQHAVSQILKTTPLYL